MTFKAKTNQYGGLKKCKFRCAIRGYRMRPGIDFDDTRTESHIPSQAGRRLLLSAAAAKRYAVESWYITGAFMNVPNISTLRVTIK